jgi:putative drug exporter of the RND superfamily
MHRRLAGTVSGRRMKWAVLVFWIAVTAVLGFGFGSKITDEENNEASSWLPASAESTEALDQTAVFQSENTLRTTVVYERAGGLTEADLAKVDSDLQTFSGYNGQTLNEIVGKDVPDGDTVVVFDGDVVGPIVSDDQQAAQIQLPINAGKDGWLLMPDLVDHIRDVAATDANGMLTHVSGQGGFAADQADAFANIDGLLLVAALGVVIVILLFTYRSPILWLFPVICAVFAMLNAQGVVYLLAKYADLTVNAQSIGILTVLVLGAGTDYALLLVARYREELRRHEDRHEAMAEALHRAGPAVIASASTVVVSMLCLMVADMNSTAGMGPVLAIGVAVVLLAMISLLPALLVIMGRWTFWPVRPTPGSHEPTSTGLWAKVGWAISHRPRKVWVGTAVVLGALSFGALGLNANGLTAEQQFTGTPDSVKGDRVVAAHFVSDASNPLQIIANESAADEVASTVAEVQGVDPEAVAPLGTEGGKTMIQAGLIDPALSNAAYATVERVRDAVHALPGADALVGGNSAINWDVQQASKHDNKLVIPLVLVVVFLILILLLRALVAPLLLIATVVLSFGAALGFSALVFEYVFDIGAADSSLPLFVFVFLVALGIDYNIFLMTRVREEAQREGSRRGALIGLAATGGVITSAGLVLAGTFGTLATLPLTFTLELGFAVAFGVLLDTLVVRSILVTALNLDLGRHMWWPSRISRREHDEQFGAPDEQFGAPDESQELETVHADA